MEFNDQDALLRKLGPLDKNSDYRLLHNLRDRLDAMAAEGWNPVVVKGEKVFVGHNGESVLYCRPKPVAAAKPAPTPAAKPPSKAKAPEGGGK